MADVPRDPCGYTRELLMRLEGTPVMWCATRAAGVLGTGSVLEEGHIDVGGGGVGGGGGCAPHRV